MLWQTFGKAYSPFGKTLAKPIAPLAKLIAPLAKLIAPLAKPRASAKLNPRPEIYFRPFDFRSKIDPHAPLKDLYPEAKQSKAIKAYNEHRRERHASGDRLQQGGSSHHDGR